MDVPGLLTRNVDDCALLLSMLLVLALKAVFSLITHLPSPRVHHFGHSHSFKKLIG